MELDELRRIAAKEELSLNYVAKDEMISKLLVQLQGHEELILKGGTAINRAYIHNRRFSEDVDCDLLFRGTAQQAIPRTNTIVDSLQGFRVSKPRIMRNTIRYDLWYVNPLGHQDKIRLEFKPQSKAAPYHKMVVQFGFVPTETALLNVYDLEELIQHKIECVRSRREGKDFIDLYYLLDLGTPARPLPQAVKEEVLQNIDKAVNNFRPLANVINHYLPRRQRPSWDLFLQELKEKVEKRL